MEYGQRKRGLRKERVLLAGGCLFLLGLSACGSPSPEAPGSGQVTGAAGAVLSSPAGAAADTGLSAPPASKPDLLNTDASRRTSPATNSRAPLTASPAAPPAPDEKIIAEQALRQARERWYAEMRESPDVTARLQALEVWAQQPKEGLDPVGFALVDEDDSVRTRAQELWEQQLMKGEGVQGVRGSD
mgnify:FL=1